MIDVKICFCGAKIWNFERHLEYVHRNRCLCGVEVEDTTKLLNHAYGMLKVGGGDITHLLIAIVSRRTKTKKMKDFLEAYRLGVCRFSRPEAVAVLWGRKGGE